MDVKRKVERRGDRNGINRGIYIHQVKSSSFFFFSNGSTCCHSLPRYQHPMTRHQDPHTSRTFHRRPLSSFHLSPSFHTRPRTMSRRRSTTRGGRVSCRLPSPHVTDIGISPFMPHSSHLTTFTASHISHPSSLVSLVPCIPRPSSLVHSSVSFSLV